MRYGPSMIAAALHSLARRGPQAKAGVAPRTRHGPVSDGPPFTGVRRRIGGRTYLGPWVLSALYGVGG